MQGVTFDFHHTLAVSPTQFGLEIRDLPEAVLRRAGVVDETLLARATAEYRLLRAEVTRTGDEIDAYRAVSTIAGMLGVDIDSATIARTVDDLMHDTRHDFCPVVGAVDTVRYVHECGVPIGVISSAVHHAYIEASLTHLGIADCVRGVTTSASSGFYKSVAGIFERAYADLRIVPRLSLHVGDSLRWDVTSAKLVDINAVWLRTDRHETARDDILLSTPDFVLDTMVGGGPRIIAWLAEVKGNYDD